MKPNETILDENDIHKLDNVIKNIKDPNARKKLENSRQLKPPNDNLKMSVFFAISLQRERSQRTKNQNFKSIISTSSMSD